MGLTRGRKQMSEIKHITIRTKDPAPRRPLNIPFVIGRAHIGIGVSGSVSVSSLQLELSMSRALTYLWYHGVILLRSPSSGRRLLRRVSIQRQRCCCSVRLVLGHVRL